MGKRRKVRKTLLPLHVAPCELPQCITLSTGASYKNHFESRSVLILLKEDPDIKRLQSSKPTVMIITPYKSQAALIKLELATENLLTSYVKVDTVDAFQGQEADIVIASLVRTRKAGFTDE